jgi:hypothetical protein
MTSWLAWWMGTYSLQCHTLHNIPAETSDPISLLIRRDNERDAVPQALMVMKKKSFDAPCA